MQYFLVPITQQTITIGSQQRTVTGPKYMTTDMAGLSFGCLAFGVEGWAIVSLAAPNPALSAETDVYTFGDLTAIMQVADVTTLAAFLTNINCPSDQLMAGITFEEALLVILKIFLVAQTISGATGSAIFTNGLGLSTTISATALATALPLQTASASEPAPASNIGSPVSPSPAPVFAASSVIGVFDFSQVDPSDTIGDVLDSVSQQYTGPIILNGVSLGGN